MAESIVSIVASALSWAAAKGIDMLLSKWVATGKAWWEAKISLETRTKFQTAIGTIKQNYALNYQDREAWREKMKAGMK